MLVIGVITRTKSIETRAYNASGISSEKKRVKLLRKGWSNPFLDFFFFKWTLGHYDDNSSNNNMQLSRHILLNAAKIILLQCTLGEGIGHGRHLTARGLLSCAVDLCLSRTWIACDFYNFFFISWLTLENDRWQQALSFVKSIETESKM